MLATGRRTPSFTEQNGGDLSVNEQGVLVGGVPLLARTPRVGTNDYWIIRPMHEINNELAVVYRLPVDVSAKAGVLALIAKALTNGDLTLAGVAAAQMCFPVPPHLSKGSENPNEIRRVGEELYRCGLLKFWDPAKHPRAGVPPNPGWFAPVGGESKSAPVIPTAMVGNPWDKPDLVGGFGGGGGGWRWSSPKLPFPGGLPEALPRYVQGGRTYGIFQAPNGRMMLQSGYDGPAASMPPESPGFDAYTKSHVEGHAAALMRQQDITEGTLYINNPEICVSCTRLLPKMLPPGSTLHVVLPDGTVIHFQGITP